MKNRNLFVLLSLLSMPTGYLWTAAESAEGRARREAQEATERMFVDQALLVDEAGFAEDDMQRAMAQSLGLEDKEQEEKKESAGIVEARAAMGTLQKANTSKKWYKPNWVHIPNTVTEIKELTTERGMSLAGIIVRDTVLNNEIAELIENYERPRMKEGAIKVEGAVNSIALSPNDTIIASATGGNIYLFDAETGMQVKMLEGHTDTVFSVAFSPDGKYVVSGSEDYTVRIWNAVTGECVQTLRGHDEGVRSVMFSPDGKYVVSGSEDCTVRIWNAVTGECVQTLRGHGEGVRSVMFSPDGKYVVSGSEDYTVRIWNTVTGECLRGLEGNQREVMSVTFSPDGQHVAAGTHHNNTILIWDFATGKYLKYLQGHRDTVNSVAFSPDGHYIASGSWDYTVRIWNAVTGECLKVLHGHNDDVRSVAFSPCGQYVVSGSFDGTVRIWDISAILAAQNQESGVLPDEDDKEAGEEKAEVARELEEATEAALEPTVVESTVEPDQELQEEEPPLTPEQLRAARLAYFDRNQ